MNVSDRGFRQAPGFHQVRSAVVIIVIEGVAGVGCALNVGYMVVMTPVMAVRLVATDMTVTKRGQTASA